MAHGKDVLLWGEMRSLLTVAISSALLTAAVFEAIVYFTNSAEDGKRSFPAQVSDSKTVSFCFPLGSCFRGGLFIGTIFA
jgi:hypothetical protein